MAKCRSCKSLFRTPYQAWKGSTLKSKLTTVGLPVALGLLGILGSMYIENSLVGTIVGCLGLLALLAMLNLIVEIIRSHIVPTW